MSLAPMRPARTGETSAASTIPPNNSVTGARKHTLEGIAPWWLGLVVSFLCF